MQFFFEAKFTMLEAHEIARNPFFYKPIEVHQTLSTEAV